MGCWTIRMVTAVRVIYKAYKFVFCCWVEVRTKAILKTEPYVRLLQVKVKFYMTSDYMPLWNFAELSLLLYLQSSYLMHSHSPFMLFVISLAVFNGKCIELWFDFKNRRKQILCRSNSKIHKFRILAFPVYLKGLPHL